MLLEIDDNKTVGDLKERFSECFPYLKLEFFSKSHGWLGSSSTDSLVEKDRQIGSISKKHQQGVMIIQARQKVGEVEKVFKKIFGLFVQVYYQVNGTWLQTGSTDDLTLQELSSMAEQEDLQTNP